MWTQRLRQLKKYSTDRADIHIYIYIRVFTTDHNMLENTDETMKFITDHCMLDNTDKTMKFITDHNMLGTTDETMKFTLPLPSPLTRLGLGVLPPARETGTQSS